MVAISVGSFCVGSFGLSVEVDAAPVYSQERWPVGVMVAIRAFFVSPRDAFVDESSSNPSTTHAPAESYEVSSFPPAILESNSNFLKIFVSEEYTILNACQISSVVFVNIIHSSNLLSLKGAGEEVMFLFSCCS